MRVGLREGVVGLARSGARLCLVAALTVLVSISLSFPSSGSQFSGASGGGPRPYADYVLIKDPGSLSVSRLPSYLTLQGFHVAESYERFVLAELTPQDQARAIRDGFEVVRMPERTVVGRGAFFFDTQSGEPSVPETLAIGLDEYVDYHTYVVQFIGPIKGEWVGALSSHGIEVLDYLPAFSYIASIQPSQLEFVRSLSFVRWVGIYQPAYKLSPALLDWRQDSIAGVISLFPGKSTARALDAIAVSGGTAYEEWGDLAGEWIVARFPAPLLVRLARLPEVAWIEPFGPASLANDLATWVVQTNVQNNRRVHSLGIRGQNQLITMADTGLDYCHEMFRQDAGQCGIPGAGHRKVQSYLQPTGACGNAVDDHGHGTHVAGTLIGDAPESGGYGTYNLRDGHGFQGRIIVEDLQAPGSTTQNCVGSNFCDGTGFCIPANFYNLFLPSFNAGSRVHSNSWGHPNLGNTYCYGATQTDSFMWEHPDFLVLFAAGNEGSNPGTLRCEANAKDIVTVGGTENGLFANDMYCESIFFSCSSRGPAGDGRRKPTVLAPAVNVFSAQRGTVTGYVGFTGTSMATPATAGSAALVRQYFLEGWYPSGMAVSSDGFTPTAALIKAVLINSAAEVTGTGAYDNNWNFYPNNNQGWGRILLDNALYFAGDQRHLMVVDERAGLLTGQSKTYQVIVLANTQPFEATLVWTDYPGAGGAGAQIRSNLDLLVTDPSGNQYRGNVYAGANPGQSTTGGSYDTLNVEESVLRLTPTPGTWTITVTATNVPNPPLIQPFALAVTARMQLSADAEPEWQQVTNWYWTGCQVLEYGTGSFRGNAYGGTNPPADTYLWTFPGGTPSSSTLRNPPAVEWHTTGTYTVSFTVTDGSGSQATDSVTVQVVQKSKPGCPF